MTNVPPVVLSTIICDRVLLDAPSKTSSIISIRDRIFAVKYPIRYPQLFFFAELTNGHESAKMSVKVVDADNNDRVMIQREAVVKFPDVRDIVSMVLGFEGLVFPHPGEYSFQLYADGELIGARRLTCIKLKKRGADGPAKQQNPDS